MDYQTEVSKRKIDKMQHEMLCQPAATAVRFELDEGEGLTCEVGAMIAMSSGLTVTTTSKNRGGEIGRAHV